MALTLVVIIYTIIPFSPGETPRQKLEETISKFDRTIRFATNESILRNSIVRLKIEFDQDVFQYSVEYGQGSNMVLPQAKDLTRLSLKDREKELEKSKKLDSQFNKTQEFLESNENLPEGVSVYGLGSTNVKDLMLETPFYLYFYPTGEKDDAIILMNTEEEMASLQVSPFEDKTIDEFYPFSDSDLANLDYALENKGKDIFQKWLRK